MIRLFAYLSLALVGLGFLGVTVPLLLNGLGGISWEYLTTEPRWAGKEGGIFPILRSTVIVVGLAVVFAVAVGLPAALYLSNPLHTRTRFLKISESALDILAATPSIVFGLFGYTLWVQKMGLGYSLLAGSLTLSIMILPLFVRLSQNALGSLQIQMAPTSQSLGLSPANYGLKLLIPSAASGLLAALSLSVARAFGETAALLFTAGYSMRNQGSLLESGRTLSVHIYDLTLNIPGGDAAAASASSALLLILLVSSLIGTTLKRRFYPNGTSPFERD